MNRLKRRGQPRGGSPAPAEDQSGASLRRLVLVVGAVVFLDTLFYSVISPLLPALSHHLHLSKFSAGILTGCYAGGTLIASIPGGILATRLGPRFAVCTGLTLMALSTLGFGWLNSAAGLDISRFIEGVGGACSWAGGLAWVVAEAPAGRRGEMIGRALGAALGGALFGPALGALASLAGRPLVFSLVAALAAVLILVTGRVPHTAKPSRQGLSVVATALRRPIFWVATWLMTVPAIFSGMLNLLGPLRLHQFGAGALTIGIVYVLSAAIESLMAPLVGRASDRHGRLAPLRLALLASALVLAIFPLPHAVVLVAVMVLLATLTLGFFWAPAMALISDVAEAGGVDQAIASAIMNLGWAGGQVIGSVAGGAVAKHAGDEVAMGLTAVLCLLTAATIGLRKVAAAINGVHGAEGAGPVPQEAAEAETGCRPGS